MKRKVKIILIVLTFTLTGCKRKTSLDVNFVENTTISQQTVAAYTMVDKYGVIHENTFIYLDMNMTNQIPISAGEQVKIIGESETNYIVIYGENKGYISKNFVLIYDIDKDKENGKSEKVEVVENIKQETYTVIETNKNQYTYNTTEFTTAKPPETLYTTNNNNHINHSSSLNNYINSAREKNNLSKLSSDSNLNDKAKYYCDIFASNNKIYNIKEYKIQASGKVKDPKDLKKVGDSIVKNSVGFNTDEISKVGISVIEGKNGTIYYVVIGL